MGVSEKHHTLDSAAAPDSEKWVISALRAPLKPVFTKPADKTDAEDQEFPTTPTFPGSRIPNRRSCPPPPKKRKPAPSRTCHYGAGVREFFNPGPDLEAIFVRRVQGA